jgi:hypothetical protein
MKYTLITVERVPKKLLLAYEAEVGVKPYGLTRLPKNHDGFQKIEILIQEKMSQYDTRVALAHELFHAFQWLAECEEEDESIYEISTVMVKALVEKRKKNK